MTKRQKIDQLIEEHKCQVSLRVHEDHGERMLAATYSYDWDAEASCRFALLCEVAESLQEAFKSILKRRGLFYAGSREGDGRDGRPTVQDLLLPDPETPAGRRWAQLMPGMEPKWVRCYDNEGRSFDQYTVVYSGRQAVERGGGGQAHYPYVGMSTRPYHPQGFGQHGSNPGQHCDVNKQGWAPAVGRKNHLGTRINFADLPDDCRRLVISDYMEIWRL